MKEIKEETSKELGWFGNLVCASFLVFAAIAFIPLSILIVGILFFSALVFIVLGIIVLIINAIVESSKKTS